MIIVRIRAAARSCRPIRLSLGDFRPFGVSDFCCTRASLLQFTMTGGRFDIGVENGRLAIRRDGAFRKFVPQVGQI
ncbi:hypothetical protein [Bradyrhizobium sp. DASA03007]|uniref:hypothetical protein n=1 Tax=unclassified Bradyrhizobium TaxID=2631580 RepID=UPI003F6FC849